MHEPQLLARPCMPRCTCPPTPAASCASHQCSAARCKQPAAHSNHKSMRQIWPPLAAVVVPLSAAMHATARWLTYGVEDSCSLAMHASQQRPWRRHAVQSGGLLAAAAAQVVAAPCTTCVVMWSACCCCCCAGGGSAVHHMCSHVACLLLLLLRRWWQRRAPPVSLLTSCG